MDEEALLGRTAFVLDIPVTLRWRLGQEEEAKPAKGRSMNGEVCP